MAELEAEGFFDAEPVGHGNYGVVYRCKQVALDRVVAVKVLNSDPGDTSLVYFEREQRAMGRVSGHPNVVPVLHSGRTSTGRPYIVMPYLSRNTLEAWINGHGPLTVRDAVQTGVRLAGALETAHRAGVLHRDVKPPNVMLTAYGEPQLCDFGIARVAGGPETRTHDIVGSLPYIGPELFRGATASVAADIYGLAATIFTLLNGDPPFKPGSEENPVAFVRRVLAGPIPDLRAKSVPDPVCSALEQGLDLDPARRPNSAAAFGEVLRAAGGQAGLDIAEVPLELPEAPAGATGETPSGPYTPVSAPSTGRQFTAASRTPPTPTTKYRPPIPTRSLVARSRLIDALRAGGRRRLILIHAPSGYGKSTLAAQWREELARDGVAVAWLTIDDDDDNVVWFLTHLVEAIRRVRPALAASLAQVLEKHGDDAGRYVLTTLIDEIHDNDDRIALVVDDWHRVTNTDTIAAFGFLLEHGCHHLQIVVTSWSRAGLPVSKLRIKDELVEIDCAALRFDTDEARSFLNDVGGLQLSETDVEALTTSTDAWVAALQLVTLSVRGGADPTSLVSRLSITDAIGEFLAENVVDTLEPELTEFLATTSITERTCSGLASALAEVPRGQAMLEDVEQRGLFLQRADEDPNWFRYHHLFAEFLRRRLERDRPDRVEGLHRAASQWFADHDYLNEAVDHALAAGDATRAVDLVEQDETKLLEQSKMTTLLEIVKKLPQRLTVSRARLQLTLTWANVLLQRLAPAAAALKSFEAALDRSDITDAKHADLRVEADVVHAMGDMFADRADRLDALVAEALSRPDDFHPRVAGVAGNVAAFAAIYRFDFDAAHRQLAWAAPYHEMMGPFATVYARCFDGIAARYQLDITAAQQYLHEAYDIGATAGPHSQAALLAGALLGELLYETGELTQAARLLDDSYRLGSDGSGVDYLTAKYVISAKIKAAQGDRTAAIDRLAAGMKLAQQLRLPRLAAAINNERVRLGIEIAPEGSARLRSPRTIPHDDGIATMTAELDENSAVRLLSASGSADDRDQACRRAVDLLAGIDGERRPLAALRAQLLLAETLTATDRTYDARVAARCEQLGLSRLLVDAGLG